MPEQLFDDLPILGELGASLRAGMARAEAASAGAPALAADRPRRRPARFGWLGTFLVLGVVGTAAAAGTLTLLRGSPIPGPKEQDTQASMSPRTDSLRVLPLRAADPDGSGRPAFAVRTGESQAGQVCAVVGQADGDEFGIVGDDDRFRAVAPGIVDGCGDRAKDAPAVVGARVFDAKQWADARTVVYGAGAEDLRAAELLVRGRWRSLPLNDGAFLTALRGYPEDSFLKLRLRYDGGRTTTQRLGQARDGIEDPGGRAWISQSYGSASSPGMIERTCVNMRPVRGDGGFGVDSPTPPLCMASRVRDRTLKPTAHYLLTARTFNPGDHGTAGGQPWRWQEPARTLVWGWVQRSRITEVWLVDGPRRTKLRRSINGGFGAVLPASTPAASLRIELRLRHGGRVILRGGHRSKGYVR
jgi:hypothetical protein